MLLDLLKRNLPAPHGVALVATGAELPTVDIGVAVRTFGAHVREDRLGMATRAGNLAVHAAQWVPCLIVVKLWNAANGLPAAERVAILAGNVEVAVRAPSVGVRRRLRIRHIRCGKQQHHQRQFGPKR